MHKTFKHIDLDTDFRDLDKKEGTEGRFYRTPFGSYPSITTILSRTGDKEYLEKWKKNVGEENAARTTRLAGNRGHNLHTLLERYLNNEEINEDGLNILEKVEWKKIRPFVSKNIDNVVLQEKHLYSNTLKIAGQVDCIAEYQGVASIIDFKTSRKEKTEDMIEDYFLQATFYSLAFEEMTGIKLKHLVIMMFPQSDYPKVFRNDRSKYIDKLIQRRNEYDTKKY